MSRLRSQSNTDRSTNDILANTQSARQRLEFAYYSQIRRVRKAVYQRETLNQQSLQATLKRGWFFGSEVFKVKLVKLAGKVLKAVAKRKNTRSDESVKQHSAERAEALVKAGMKVCDLDEEALAALPRGDERKVLIALTVKRETTVPLDWIAEHLHMGARSTVSREVEALGKSLPGSRKLIKLHHEILEASV